MIDLYGCDYEEIIALVTNAGYPKYRAQQIWEWLYKHKVDAFSEMKNIPQTMQIWLQNNFLIGTLGVSKELVSFDETRKWLVNLTDNNEIETVFIPAGERGTLCVSSQVGCTLTCKFCHTGTQTLVRNLTAGEIVAQFMLVKKQLNHLTNIVMMGMGEPLYNYDNVKKALQIIMHTKGLNLSKRRITLSTSGVVPMIAKCAEDLAVNLAISLHATNDELRNILVPLNKKYPIAELLQACRHYYKPGSGRRITFEYVMLHEVNDHIEHAKELLQLIEGIPAKINLIPFNPWPNSPFIRSTNERIKAFADIIERAGYASPVRTPRGEDIMAACGQLKSESIRQRKAQVINA